MTVSESHPSGLQPTPSAIRYGLRMGYDTGSEPLGDEARPDAECPDDMALCLPGLEHGNIGHVCTWPPRAIQASAIASVARLIEDVVARIPPDKDRFHRFVTGGDLGGGLWALARLSAAGFLAAGKRDDVTVAQVADRAGRAYERLIGADPPPSRDTELRTAAIVSIALDDEPPTNIAEMWEADSGTQLDIIVCLLALTAEFIVETPVEWQALGGSLLGFTDRLFEGMVSLADDEERHNYAYEQILAQVPADRRESWTWRALLRFISHTTHAIRDALPTPPEGFVPRVGCDLEDLGGDGTPESTREQAALFDIYERAVDLINAALRDDGPAFMRIAEESRTRGDWDRLGERTMLVCAAMTRAARTGNVPLRGVGDQ